MTTRERAVLRQSLINQGFRRTGYTQDAGDGVYTETWTKQGAEILLSWGPKEQN